jgi:hypothetical protein
VSHKVLFSGESIGHFLSLINVHQCHYNINQAWAPTNSDILMTAALVDEMAVRKQQHMSNFLFAIFGASDRK